MEININNTETTASYIWQTDHRSELGSGATGAVFRGLHKKTGRKVAVKVIKKNLKPQFLEYTQKEVELLRDLNHSNIVNFIDDEEVKGAPEEREHNSLGSRAIVLEMCEGGTVQKLLQAPQNRFGLPDHMVLDILRDMTEALKYMRSKHIIHRDIKSDNILIAHSETGKYIYKLTDFGGAIQTDGSDEFTSVFGTVELMHPLMLEKGAINRSMNVIFDEAVDLWSFGVVLYQICTARFPFIPFRGRADKDTLLRIISQKSSDHISGFDDESGQITWKCSLPDTCQISKGLNNIMTPIIAGLLQGDKAVQMTRERLFETVEGIPSLTVPVYIADQGSIETIYMDQQASIGDLLNKMSIIEKRDKVNLLLPDKSIALSESSSALDALVEIFGINHEKPIMALPEILPKYPEFSFEEQMEPDITSPDLEMCGTDIWKWARQCVAIGYLFRRRIHNLSCLQDHDMQLIHILYTIGQEQMQKMETKKQQICILLQVAKKYTCLYQHGNPKSSDTHRIETDVRRLCDNMHQAKLQTDDDCIKSAFNENLMPRKNEVEKRAQQIRHLLTTMESSAGYLREIKSHRLTHNMRQRRTLEMKLIHRQCIDIKGIFKWITAQVGKSHNYAMKILYRLNKFQTSYIVLEKSCDSVEKSIIKMLGVDNSLDMCNIQKTCDSNSSISSRTHSSGCGIDSQA